MESRRQGRSPALILAIGPRREAIPASRRYSAGGSCGTPASEACVHGARARPRASGSAAARTGSSAPAGPAGTPQRWYGMGATSGNMTSAAGRLSAMKRRPPSRRLDFALRRRPRRCGRRPRSASRAALGSAIALGDAGRVQRCAQRGLGRSRPRRRAGSLRHRRRARAWRACSGDSGSPRSSTTRACAAARRCA